MGEGSSPAFIFAISWEMQKIDWRPASPIEKLFSSPNTGEDIHFKPLHPSGGHLFAAARGETYEQAVNFSLTYSEQGA